MKMLVLSDIHLFHRRTPTKHIAKNIKKMLSSYLKIKIDMIAISGDLFDRLAVFDDDDVLEFIDLMDFIIRYCANKDIVFRILKGTPSHDNDQIQVIDALIKCYDFPIDYKYMKVLDIEHIERFNMTFLYVPDQHSPDALTTYSDVIAKMNEHGVQQVDIAFTHGLFRFQIPEMAKDRSTHSEDNYIPLVKHFILNGHDHTHKSFGIIKVPGSFDRLGHNYEDPKGWLDITITEFESTCLFIENKDAMIYKTINVSKLSLEKTIKAIEKELQWIPNNHYLAIKAPSDHPAMVAFDEIKKKYPYHHLSKNTNTDDREPISKLINNIDIDYSIINITPDNLPELLISEVSHQLSEEEKEIAKRIIKSL